ncbi:MAG TPA: hypothetical protein VFU65_19575 [Actinocrinis sp.]|nr:hypothetical protein [Actinocrinis sp.]
MSEISETLLARVRAEVAAREVRLPLAALQREALVRPVSGSGLEALRGDQVTVVAELDPAYAPHGALVDRGEECGLAALAIAPAPHHRHEPRHAIAQVCSRTRMPVLYMDLVVSSYQLWEARAGGADLVLLTAAAMPCEALVSLVERADSLGLTAVVDVRDGADLMLALRASARAVLVRPSAHVTDEAARSALCDLLSMIPDSVLRIAECGAAGRSDLIAYARKGADAVLLGRALLNGDDPRATVTGLAAIGAHPSLFRRRVTDEALPR